MRKFAILLFLLALIFLSGCSSTLAGVDFGDALSPCDIDEEDIGDRLTLGGLVEIVDSTAPDGWYAALERESCRVGIWIPIESLETWKPANPDTYKEGAVLIIEGYLSSQPLPNRPEEYQLIVELDHPPQELLPVEDKEPQSSSEFPPCGYGDLEIGESVIGEGSVLLVDISAAAGVYLELEEEGCFKRVWVESRFFEQWTKSEQNLLKAGNFLTVQGIYTEVRGEPTIDISEPPTTN